MELGNILSNIYFFEPILLNNGMLQFGIFHEVVEGSLSEFHLFGHFFSFFFQGFFGIINGGGLVSIFGSGFCFHGLSFLLGALFDRFSMSLVDGSLFVGLQVVSPGLEIFGIEGSVFSVIIFFGLFFFMGDLVFDLIGSQLSESHV
jgi:hypothetical protein